MRTPHERSVGAAMERKAMRAYLRRRRKSLHGVTTDYWGGHLDAITEILAWVLGRQRRYDKKPGGLGK